MSGIAMKQRHIINIKDNQQGFTIIEALIALVILSFAVLGIFRIHIQAVKTNAFNKRMLSGLQFARSGIEQVRSKKYTAVNNGMVTDNSVNASDFTDVKMKFLREITISNVSGIPKTKKAMVQVGWDTLGDCTAGTMAGCDHNITLETYITDLD